MVVEGCFSGWSATVSVLGTLFIMHISDLNVNISDIDSKFVGNANLAV